MKASPHFEPPPAPSEPWEAGHREALARLQPKERPAMTALFSYCNSPFFQHQEKKLCIVVDDTPGFCRRLILDEAICPDFPKDYFFYPSFLSYQEDHFVLTGEYEQYSSDDSHLVPFCLSFSPFLQKKNKPPCPLGSEEWIPLTLSYTHPFYAPPEEDLSVCLTLCQKLAEKKSLTKEEKSRLNRLTLPQQLFLSLSLLLGMGLAPFCWKAFFSFWGAQSLP